MTKEKHCRSVVKSDMNNKNQQYHVHFVEEFVDYSERHQGKCSPSRVIGKWTW